MAFKKKGSLILVAAGILSAMLLFYFLLMKVVGGFARQADVLSDRHIAYSLAEDLANILAYQIQTRISKRDPNDPIIKALCAPLNQMAPVVEEYDFAGDYARLQLKMLNLMTTIVKLEMDGKPTLSINPSDFKIISEDPRHQYEKVGFVRFSLPLKIDKKKRIYHFTLPVDVVLPIPYQLKRFVLYSQDGGLKDGKEGFNKISQDQFGNPNGTDVKPLYVRSYPWTKTDLKGGDKAKKLKTLFENSGFIFFGGEEEVVLNLGAGLQQVGDGRHLFMGDPAFPIAKNLYENPQLSALSDYSIRFRDAGLDHSEISAALADSDSSSDKYWLTYYKQSLGDQSGWRKALNSSALKLYGHEEGPADGDAFAPALVIGKVKRRFIRIVQYYLPQSKRPAGVSELNFFRGAFTFVPSADYPTFIQAPEAALGSVALALNLTPDGAGYTKYINSFSSRRVEEHYNRGIDYIFTHGEKAAPEAVIESENNPYFDFETNSGRGKFPNDKLTPGTTQLNLENLAGNASGDKGPIASKSSWILKIAGIFSNFLRARGLIFGDVLDLKSVILVKKGNVELDTGNSNPWTVMSSGAIVASDGDIYIKSGIKKSSSAPDAFLALVALNNHTIHIQTDQPINALLISSGGMIKFNTKGETNVVGGLLAKDLFKTGDNLKNVLKYGGNIDYDTILSEPINQDTAKKQLLISTGVKARRSHESL